MLVLSRKLHESIRIGEDVTVTIVRINQHAVRLGITAPASMKIARTELIVDCPAAEKAQEVGPGESQQAGE